MEGEDHQPQPLPPPPPGYTYVYPTRIPYSSPIVVLLAIIVSEFIAIMIEVHPHPWLIPTIPFHHGPFLLVTLLIFYVAAFWFVGPTVDWVFDQIGGWLDKLGRLYELELVDPFENYDEEYEYVEYDEDEDFDEEIDLGDTSPDQARPYNVSFKGGVFFDRTAACCMFLIMFQVLTYLEAKNWNTGAAKSQKNLYIMATIVLRGFYFRFARHVVTLCRRQLRGENHEEERALLICSLVLLICLIFHYMTLLLVTDASTGGPIVKFVVDSSLNRTRPELTQQHHSVNSYLHVLKKRASPEIWLQNEELYLISYLPTLILIH